MALGNTEAILRRSKTIQEGDVQISERSFNLIIGGMLMWGFLLNYLTVALFGDRIVSMVYGMNPFVFLIGYIVLVLVGNTMVVIEVTGQQLLDALEWGSREVPEELGGFLQTAGLTYEIHTYIESSCTEDVDGMFTVDSNQDLTDAQREGFRAAIDALKSLKSS